MTQDTETKFTQHELSPELKKIFDGIVALLKPHKDDVAPAVAVVATALGHVCGTAYGREAQAMLLQVAMKNLEAGFNEESNTLCLHMMSMAHAIGDDSAHEEMANAPTSRTEQ